MGVIGTEGFDYYFNGTDSTVGAQNRWVKGFLDQQLVAGRFGGKAFYSARSGGTEEIGRTLDVPATTGNFTFGLSFKATALGTGLIDFQNVGGSANQFMIYLETNGAISFKQNYYGTTQSTSAAGLVTANAWYYLECSVTLSSTGAGSYTIDLDGATVLTATGKNTAMSGNTVGGIILIEPSGGALYYDDMYWSDDLVRLGPQRIEYHPVTSDVAGGAWSPNTGTTKYTQIDELATDQSDYISASNVGDTQRFGVEGLLGSPAQLNAVNVVMHCASTDGIGSRQIKATIDSGGTVSDGSAITLASAAKFKNQLYLTNPATGAKFTPAEYNALKVGVKVAA